MQNRINRDDSPLRLHRRLRRNGRQQKAPVSGAGGEGPANAGVRACVRVRSEVRDTARDVGPAHRRTECLAAAGRSLGRRRTGLAMRALCCSQLPPAAVKGHNNTAAGSVPITRPGARATDLHRAESASRVAVCRLFVLFLSRPRSCAAATTVDTRADRSALWERHGAPSLRRQPRLPKGSQAFAYVCAAPSKPTTTTTNQCRSRAADQRLGLAISLAPIMNGFARHFPRKEAPVT